MSAQLQEQTPTTTEEKGRSHANESQQQTQPQENNSFPNGTNREFNQWSGVPVNTIYGNANMANQGDYQFSTNYYPFPGNGAYGVGGVGENPWGISYAPASHQPPLGSPPNSGNAYAVPPGGDFFGGGSNYPFTPTYNFFDYSNSWGTSIITHEPNPGPKPPQDYYAGGTSGYRLIDGSAGYGNSNSNSNAIRELDHGISGMSIGGNMGSQAPVSIGAPGPQQVPSNQILRDFGQVVGPTVAPPAPAHPQAPPKPLTWADKVKQAPKDNIIPKSKTKVPIGGVGSRSKETGSIWNGGMPGSPPGPLAALQNAGIRFGNSQPGPLSMGPPAGNGWGSMGGQVVTARKPAALVTSGGQDHHHSSLQNGSANGALGAIENNVGLAVGGQKETSNGISVAQNAVSSVGKGIAEGDSDALKKLKMETNPSELSLNTRGARYFVIKSYSEDDVHRSIKYGIWCSTDHGNKRLDGAFKERTGKGPIYLFYSVNASGHFCGIAQMISQVDYNTDSGVWAQDKWKGLFKVKWLYVKDVPNGHLRHIRLENNENKPVTNSRDTQEVLPEKGRQVLRLIHQYRHTTSLFDDFGHYEKRQLEEDSRKNVPA